ncbi:MAG: GrdX family protein [Emergencia sp.]|nr:GrdX family protein [Emergencia sp.]
MKPVIITNNPKVQEKYNTEFKVIFRPELDQTDILKEARDYIHLGARLIMHPMMGRIKPHETPYKSVFLQTGGSDTHFDSILMIEDSLLETEKFLKHTAGVKYDDTLLDDLQFIDLQLLGSGIEEFRR